MKLLVTGAGGLLGSEMVSRGRARGHELFGLDRAALDVTDAERVARVLSDARPDWVVHCAAYTAVDRAEQEPERCRAVNVEGTAHVARAAARVGAGMAYVSTDYVFDGRKRSPYAVDDPPHPLSVYGRSKLDGERAVREAFRGVGQGPASPPAAGDSAHLIVRTGWLYGEGGRGFVRAILDRAQRGEPLRIVSDQRGRPTYAGNVADAVLELVELCSSGRWQGAVAGPEGVVWHVADGGEATWLELAREALEIAGVRADVRAVTSDEYGAAAQRPAYSVLDLGRTEAELGRPMPDWRAVLAEVLAGPR